jgi:enamine deaminase RidA (YjgF/YER057c/UK114 family)
VSAERPTTLDIDDRLVSMGIVLPPPSVPGGNYVKSVQTGRLLFVSGHLPDSGGTPLHMGKLGHDLTTADGYAAARQAAINLLGAVRNAIGDLNRVTRVVKLLGMVNSAEDFIEQSRVIDGASDLFHEVFGDVALHTRSAVGMAQLPRNNCVELEAILELADEPAQSGRPA